MLKAESLQDLVADDPIHDRQLDNALELLLWNLFEDTLLKAKKEARNGKENRAL